MLPLLDPFLALFRCLKLSQHNYMFSKTWKITLALQSHWSWKRSRFTQLNFAQLLFVSLWILGLILKIIWYKKINLWHLVIGCTMYNIYFGHTMTGLLGYSAADWPARVPCGCILLTWLMAASLSPTPPRPPVPYRPTAPAHSSRPKTAKDRRQPRVKMMNFGNV